MDLIRATVTSMSPLQVTYVGESVPVDCSGAFAPVAVGARVLVAAQDTDRVIVAATQARQSYTPTLSGFSGSRSGTFQTVGGFAVVSGRVTTDDAGSGTWKVSLPVTAVSSSSSMMLGTASLQSGSAAWVLSAHMDGSDGTKAVFRESNAVDSNLVSDSWGLAGGANLRFTLTYPI